MRKLTLALALIFSLSSCSFFSASRITKIRGAEEVSQELSDRIWDDLLRQKNKLVSARAMAEIFVSAYGNKEKFSQVVVFKRPNLLRVELFASKLNRLVAMIILQGGSVAAYDLRQNVIYRGAPSRENFSRILYLPFEAEEFMLWLSGKLLVNRSASKVYGFDDGRYVFEVEKDKSSTMYVDVREDLQRACGGKYCINSIELRSKGFFSKTLFYSEYRYAATRILPVDISFRIPKISVEGEIEFSTTEYNPNFGKSAKRLFKFRQPRGARLVDLDSLDSENISIFR